MLTLEEAEQWIEDRTQTNGSDNSITLGISEKGQELIVGTCALFARNRAFFSAFCGYELLSEYWGKGIMTEALTEILNYGFSSWSLNRVVAATSVENLASIRLLERLSFQREGMHRQYGFWNGHFHLCNNAVKISLVGQ